MKVFILEFKNPYTYRCFLEAASKIKALEWFAENTPARTKLISINEGNPEGLQNIKEMFKK